MLIFGWINPLLFLYRKAVQLNHEFLADENAVDSQSIREYQLLLVNEPRPSENLHLSSSFTYSFTKKRLIMMTKKTSMRVAIAKELMMVSILVLCALAFGERAVAQQIKKADKQMPENAQQIQKGILPAQKAAKDVQKKKPLPKKEIQIYVSANPADAKATSTPKAQTWTLKQDGGDVQFKSTKPLTEEEKKEIEDEFVKKTSTPFSKFPPTQAQLDSFLDDAVYGVWIDGKRIFNWELKLYSANDFSEVFVSTLMKNARDHGKYLFHVELKKKDGC
jgi:hypothetical protein